MKKTFLTFLPLLFVVLHYVAQTGTEISIDPELVHFKTVYPIKGGYFTKVFATKKTQVYATFDETGSKLWEEGNVPWLADRILLSSANSAYIFDVTFNLNLKEAKSPISISKRDVNGNSVTSGDKISNFFSEFENFSLKSDVWPTYYFLKKDELFILFQHTPAKSDFSYYYLVKVGENFETQVLKLGFEKIYNDIRLRQKSEPRILDFDDKNAYIMQAFYESKKLSFQVQTVDLQSFGSAEEKITFDVSLNKLSDFKRMKHKMDLDMINYDYRTDLNSNIKFYFSEDNTGGYIPTIDGYFDCKKINGKLYLYGKTDDKIQEAWFMQYDLSSGTFTYEKIDGQLKERIDLQNIYSFENKDYMLISGEQNSLILDLESKKVIPADSEFLKSILSYERLRFGMMGVNRSSNYVQESLDAFFIFSVKSKSLEVTRY